jgi:isoleucyl-tRNA synthetase
VIVEKGGEGVKGEVEGLAVEVRKAEGEKCERCWQYKPTVGQGAEHSTLCARCAGIIENS